MEMSPLDSKSGPEHALGTPPPGVPAIPSLRDCVTQSVRRSLADMGENLPKNFFDLVMREVEIPLLNEVSERCRGNQSKMAQILGLSRTTLRKKLKDYGL
jgi:Fis family transcriptional regulator, factor for inversion stimulation protein